jgi:hypothetical protein
MGILLIFAGFGAVLFLALFLWSLRGSEEVMEGESQPAEPQVSIFDQVPATDICADLVDPFEPLVTHRPSIRQAVCLVVLPLLLWYIIGWGSHYALNAMTATANRQQHAPLIAVVDRWLESQRRGRNGAEAWDQQSPFEPIHLRGVQSWEIVDIGPCNVVVRVESSDRAGKPHHQIWKILIFSDAVWSVEQVAQR